MGDFRKLKVWQEAKDIAVAIYKMTNDGRFSKDFRFRDQIRSAAISISSNIAEGDELMTNKQAIRHFYIAKGSLAELQTQVIIAEEIGYISNEHSDILQNRLMALSVKLQNLINHRAKFTNS